MIRPSSFYIFIVLYTINIIDKYYKRIISGSGSKDPEPIANIKYAEARAASAKNSLGAFLKGSYQVAKWNGTKVAVKILDKDCYADQDSMGMNYLHECKPDPIIHCNLKPKNIMLDNGGHLKVAGFGLVNLSKLSADKAKLVQPGSLVDGSSLYVAPEVYKGEIFDRSADAFSFGLILYEMLEGVPAFHPKSSGEALTMIALKGKRPAFKVKSKNLPADLRELIEECWDPKPLARPTFSEIIVRLDKICAHCAKQGWWKENFKFPWELSDRRVSLPQ